MMEVSCVPGFDGGLDQHFVIEVFKTVNNTQVLVASNWTEDPVLSVWGLEPNSNYIVSVKAVNDRGESSPVFVGGRTGDETSFLPISIDQSRLPFLIVIVVVLVAVIIVSSFIAVILASRYRKKERDKFRLKSVDPDDLTEEQLAQFREAEAMLEQAELIQTTPPPSPPRLSPQSGTIQRKVSFRDDGNGLCPECGCGGSYRRRQRTASQSPVSRYTSNGHTTLPLLPSPGRNGIYPPVQRAVVKSFSIDKMRPICPVCNPRGNTPYPPDFPVHPSQQDSAQSSSSSPETDQTSTHSSNNNSRKPNPTQNGKVTFHSSTDEPKMV